jgi:NADPH:quinone reductase-like Zn-dependent oxidoreductase
MPDRSRRFAERGGRQERPRSSLTLGHPEATERDFGGDDMRGIAVENFGDEPSLMELPDPQPGPGEVLVAIDTASINPIDWKVAQGAFREMMGHEFPLVLGFDSAGRVDAIGPGARRFAVGDLVHGQFWGDTVGRGTFAERVVIAERPVTRSAGIGAPEH